MPRAAQVADEPGPRVLVADDNRDAAETLAMLLRLDGFEVDVAHSGSDALARACGCTYDAIVLDIGMPQGDGYHVARTLRAQPETRQTMLIALTGWAQDADRRRALDTGFDEYFTKPVDHDVLLASLRRQRRRNEASAGASGSGNPVTSG